MKKLFPMILILMLLGACKPGKTVPATVSPPYRQPHLTPFLGPTETTFQLASLTPQSSPSAKAPLIPITSTTAAAVLPNFDHIVLIVLENTDYSVALDSSSMPHLAELAEKNSLLSNYFAVSHPSLPNYLALMSGSTQGVTSDCTNCFVSAQNLAGELDQAEKTWKAYLESMPSPCFLGEASRYAQQHNPLIYFDSVRLDTSICKNDIVPLTQLWPDLTANQFPDFAFIMPDMCNSGHDCGATTADTASVCVWLNGVTPLSRSRLVGSVRNASLTTLSALVPGKC